MKNQQIQLSPSRWRRDAGEMFSLVELWLESDLTQAEFCRAHGLSVSVLSYWLRKYRDEQSGPEKMGSFVALSVREVNLNIPAHTEPLIPAHSEPVIRRNACHFGRY